MLELQMALERLIATNVCTYLIYRNHSHLSRRKDLASTRLFVWRDG